ncbi:MFS transporter [Photobacterium sp. MCCC 1A19761]|uniref:MFS transporter n=1 Tax=Photobacterium sp. MCCC 1A19761 TaxID=3115000 RepID=UPI00307DEF10
MDGIHRTTRTFMLFAVLMAVFIVPSSISGTAIALPFISAELQSDPASLQWVVNAFNLTFACFTLIWGKFADVFGRKRSFIAGALIYTLASIGSGLAPNILWLDVFRALAGVGGAAIFSCGSALFTHTFEGEQRTRVFALFGVTAGLGITFGPTVSGVLLELWSWQAIFAMHAVVLTAVLVMSSSIPSDADEVGSVPQVDFPGAALFIAGMFLLMLALSRGYEWGWLSLKTALAAFVGGVMFILFIVRIKRAVHPVLNLVLLRNHGFLGLILVPVVASFTFVTLLTYFPTYLTGPMQQSAATAGLMMLFLTLPVLVLPLIAGNLASRGVRTARLIFFSIVSMLLGIGLLGLLVELSASLSWLAVALLLIGMGMGISAGLVDGEALSSVKADETGMAAGVLNTFRLGSEAVAVALYGALMSASLTRLVPEHLSQLKEGDVEAWIAGMASGNFTGLLELVNANEQATLSQQMIAVYKMAFTTTNALLGSLAVIVSLLALYCLRKVNRLAHCREVLRR